MEITLSELKGLLTGSAESAIRVGQKYLIRTVTLYYTGEVVSVSAAEIVLTKAAWIPDTGRFADCLRTGSFAEVEPFLDDVIVPRGGIIDATVWRHDLPAKQTP